MLTRRMLITVVLLILPALSQCLKSTCEIPSVEAGDDTTLTVQFGEDLTNARSMDFTLVHQDQNAKGSQIMLSCHFTNGDVECDKTTCCTWDRHVTDVFRVYIHNVSQELEGKFWGFVSPADMIQQKYCNFTLKALTCSTDSINATNSHLICNNQPVIMGQTCTVTCIYGHYFQENNTSVTYTCVAKNKWFPEISITSCEAYTCPTKSITAAKSHMICNNQPVFIGQTCTVTCISGHYFQENHTTVTYTCVWKNKWSPEIPVTSCEEQARDQETSDLHLLLSILIPIVSVIVTAVIVIFIICYKARQRKRKQKRIKEEELLLAKGITPLQRAQKEMTDYWLECIRKWYPQLESRTYFVPPLHLNRGQRSPQSPQDSDVRDDTALQRVLLGLRTLADNFQQTDNHQDIDNPQEKDKLQQAETPQQADNHQQEEVMIVISQLQFGKYIGQPSYAAAVALLPMSRKLSALFHYDEEGCDILIIHKILGPLTLQITSTGENFSQLEMTEQKQDKMVMKKVKKAAKQLNKADAVLKHLTSDILDITHNTKILVLPNISSSQLLRASERFPSTGKFLCECLGAKSVDDAVKLCLLKDQLSDNQTPSDINHSSLQTLREWWQHVRTSRSGSLLTSSLYEQLVARFCGPATTVEVHCVTAPRLNIRTLEKAVSETGERVDRITLFPNQVDILNQSPALSFFSGPPGTGKTIVLIMQGLAWLQRGYDVHVVSTCDESRAVTFVIEHQLQKTAKTLTAMSRVHNHQFDLRKDGEVETAVSCLKSQSEGRQLCVIADEVVRDYDRKFTVFCDQLITGVPGVYIWGACLYHDVRPLRLEEVKLTTPLRSPPVLVREVMKADEIKDKRVHDYTVSDVPVSTDGPPIMRIKHRDGQLGHTRFFPRHCEKCGHEVAHVLTKLGVVPKGYINGPPPLQYRDVLVLCQYYPTDAKVDSNGQPMATGMVRGLLDCHVPVRVVKEGDEAAIRATALGVDDMVTVAWWTDVRGLERKVIVVEGGSDKFDRLRAMSRCSSQMVVIECTPV